MMRRRLLGMLLAPLALRGTAETPPPPAGYKPPSLPGQAAGDTSAITRARLVIVSGPGGTVNGIFIYQPGTTPGAGNGPVLSGTEASADPFGNATVTGWTSYGPGGSYMELVSNILNIVAAAGQQTPGSLSHNGAAGGVAVGSGTVAGGDSPATITLESVQNSFNATGAPLIILNASKAQIPPVLVAITGSTVEIQNSVIIDNNLTVTGTASINGSTSTGLGDNGGVTSGPSGTVNSFPAAGPNHTHAEAHHHPL